MQEDYSESVMVALLPITTDWCRIECPHMTLVYVGEIPDLPPTAFNELAKDAASIAMLSNTLTLAVSGVEYFGETEDVKVLTLKPSSELLAMRRMVEHWNGSEYKDFKPHATVGPRHSILEEVPRYLAFDRIMVGWGKENLTFWLKR